MNTTARAAAPCCSRREVAGAGTCPRPTVAAHPRHLDHKATPIAARPQRRRRNFLDLRLRRKFSRSVRAGFRGDADASGGIGPRGGGGGREPLGANICTARVRLRRARRTCFGCQRATPPASLRGAEVGKRHRAASALVHRWLETPAPGVSRQGLGSRRRPPRRGRTAPSRPPRPAWRAPQSSERARLARRPAAAPKRSYFGGAGGGDVARPPALRRRRASAPQPPPAALGGAAGGAPPRWRRDQRRCDGPSAPARRRARARVGPWSPIIAEAPYRRRCARRSTRIAPGARAALPRPRGASSGRRRFTSALRVTARRRAHARPAMDGRRVTRCGDAASRSCARLRRRRCTTGDRRHGARIAIVADGRMS